MWAIESFFVFDVESPTTCACAADMVIVMAIEISSLTVSMGKNLWGKSMS